MGVAEIIGMVVTVAGAAWTVSEKIGNLKDDMDRRLDEMRDRLISGEIEGAALKRRLEEMEQTNIQWFNRLNKEIYKCTIPPQD